jgi:hypothetical protein
MKKYYLYGGAVLVVVIFIGIMLSGSQKPIKPALPAGTLATSSPQPSAARLPTASGTAVSATSSPQDIVPGLYPNPINSTSTSTGIKISSVLVENNTDAAGNSVSDHLQFTIQNLTAKTLSNLEVYYTITDTPTNQKEGYYKSLAGFTLPPHGSGTVHFDNQSGYGHYQANMRGIYGTATDQLKFTVEVSTPGYAPAYISATKAPGGAEVVGQ